MMILVNEFVRNIPKESHSLVFLFCDLTKIMSLRKKWFSPSYLRYQSLFLNSFSDTVLKDLNNNIEKKSNFNDIIPTFYSKMEDIELIGTLQLLQQQRERKKERERSEDDSGDGLKLRVVFFFSFCSYFLFASMVFFCPTCANMLLVEHEVHGMRFYCQTCPYVFHIEVCFVKWGWKIYEIYYLFFS